VTFKLDAERHFGFLIHDLARLLRRNLDRRLQDLGLTQTQWRAIAHLSRSEGMTQSALADSLDVQPITLARLVDRMENAGWVERRSHPLDRRAVQLYLTDRCQPILAELHTRAGATLDEAVAGLGAGQQRQLIESLQRIKKNLVAADGAASDMEATRRTNADVGRKSAKLQRSR
jgi:MarR family transcriptional regulator, transcriptional regulator for hemolysin